ncbi:hypothetical protein [Bradyrhizobium diazoefficiens]|uniref:Uncharacterized protein n=1 Tax=Bradyrhizobium diazoefficiens TaxID=1355477 RepID=A0A809X8J8_9BRAD|nr:hypothetical protein [Bradyrhizobium diazoefficiens]WLA76846.1 hypothetical protein QIH77_17245 [Bradyrhizobium diazoefficiens]BCE23797.1 hypothetical protein XF1B_64780 [Bradyrhizobium diazoefficiens]BCE93565.1 hypothetical protein XF10B_63630 [Bradyrhizobium diazoefficiens]BCF28501.1 hypothetical protein XF14B_64530 [Bradyrhizobium diazoefficiens]
MTTALAEDLRARGLGDVGLADAEAMVARILAQGEKCAPLLDRLEHEPDRRRRADPISRTRRHLNRATKTARNTCTSIEQQ